MQKIYISISDEFVANKILDYLKSYFDNISLIDFSFDINKDSIVISDFNSLNQNSQLLKDINIILLVDTNEKDTFFQNKLLSTTVLEIPIVMQDLVDVIEQKKISIANIYFFKDWYLNLNSNTLHKDNININLSDKEALILKEFFINNSIDKSKGISKEHFLKVVWNINNIEIESQSLESYISILRRKFHDNNVNLTIIKDKEGYLLS